MLALMSFQAFNITAFTLGLPALSSQHVMDHQNNGRVHTSHDTYGKSYGCWRKRHHDKTRMSASVDEKVEKIAEVEKGGVEENGLSGALVLLTVPLAWGTFAPVVRYMYEIDPPVPGFVFSAGYYIVAAITLLAINIMMQVSSNRSADSNNATDELKNTQNELPIQGGLELGTYLFFGNCLQVVGLESVPADRAAFEVQLTTVIVPFLQVAIGGNQFGGVTSKTWLATVLAFLGVLTMGMEGKGSEAGDVVASAADTSVSHIMGTMSLQSGDVLIFLAALAYSFHVIRLGRYAPTTSALRLAAAKASTEAVFSIALIAWLMTFGQSTSFGQEVTSFFSAFQNGGISSQTIVPAVGSCLWTGWVTCAYTIYAQSYGQRSVSPSDANLVYASQPIFSSLFAYILLGEVLGTYGYIGGALIAAAVLLITSQEPEGLKNGNE